MTSSKGVSNPQITKTTLAGQNKKAPDKGEAKPLGKIKKNVAKLLQEVVLVKITIRIYPQPESII